MISLHLATTLGGHKYFIFCNNHFEASLNCFVEKNNNFSILEKHCEDCCYFPLCFGGCAYENYNKYGTIRDKVNCRKHAYDTFISEFYEEIFIKEGIEYIE